MNPPGKTTLSRMQRTAQIEAERIELSQDGRVRAGLQKEVNPDIVAMRDDYMGIVRLIDAIESDEVIKRTLVRRMREMSAVDAAVDTAAAEEA